MASISGGVKTYINPEDVKIEHLIEASELFKGYYRRNPEKFKLELNIYRNNLEINNIKHFESLFTQEGLFPENFKGKVLFNKEPRTERFYLPSGAVETLTDRQTQQTYLFTFQGNPVKFKTIVTNSVSSDTYYPHKQLINYVKQSISNDIKKAAFESNYFTD